MKKSLIISIVMIISTVVSGQSHNLLNTFLLESIQDYIQWYNRSLNSIHRFDTINYICSDNIDALPSDFPYDSLHIEKLSLSSIESNPMTIKKALKQFVKAIRVNYKLENNVLDICISNCNIRRPRKGKVQIEVDGESVMHYYYEYNCETNRWERKGLVP